MRINANIAALNASRNLAMSQAALGSSLEKLSSGYRINRAADDAAGLAISEGLRSEIRGSGQAQRNAQDGISFLQTAEGGLNEVSSMLQRMRELAVQAANGTSGGTAEQAEINQLKSEIDGIGARSTFAGSSIFKDYSAASAGLNFQIGSGGTVNDQISVTTNLSLLSSGVGVLGGAASSVAALDVTTSDTTAQAAIVSIDKAIAGVSATRATLGAVQNRLEHTVSNLGVAVENLTASESRIRDTDMATEMVNYTRNSILSQAGTAMLAQANQVPQSILQLLR
ncbi:MAG: Flagellin protein FlaA [Acidimicrobiales bacterium]|nr:Flagellin protein FlaA [Acidimicrobiales bacterium]